MNILKMASAGHAVSTPTVAADSLVDCIAHHPSTTSVLEADADQHSPSSTDVTSALPALAALQSQRIAIKVRGRILFIHLCDVVSVQAKGRCVWLQLHKRSYLLRESISAVAEQLEAHGFIRIHRSVLVNTLFVEEIRPLPTGEYSLRVEGGKEYTVTRTHKKNLKSIAKFWIGAGAFFHS